MDSSIETIKTIENLGVIDGSIFPIKTIETPEFSYETMDNENIVKKGEYIVYLLYNTMNRFVYIGSTNNRVRRLRQHNGELVGGAKYTHSKKGLGEWRFYGYIENLEKRVALSIEKRIQIRSRKMKAREPLQRRLDAIGEILLDYNDAYFFTELGKV